jgi:hypothetical protein
VSALQPGTFASFLIKTSYPASPGGSIFTNNASIFSATNDFFITSNASNAQGTLTPANTPHQCQLAKTDITVNSTSASGATVNYAAPTTTGATCTGTIQCSPASGTVFPIGTNPVGCQITNQDGAGGGQFNVIVVDAQRPDLRLIKYSYGPYYAGQQGFYLLDVKNIGAVATNGTTVTVTEDPPAGMTITNMSGNGWTCSAATRSCTRNSVLAANASYPPIFVTVSFATYGTIGNVTNSATVSGGGDGTTVNNTSSNIAQVLGLGTGTALASGVAIDGRVLAGDGRGLANAKVLLTSPSGETRFALTGKRGAFHFDDIQSGQTYTVSVASRLYTFAPQVISVNDNIGGLIFVPDM